MARVGGRSVAMSWIAGLFCATVIAGLIWFAAPIAPVFATFVGDTLRSTLP